MRALIWKELRELFPWALLAALALGGAEIYALFRKENPYGPDYYYNQGITLCRAPFLSVTLFGCALAGLGLGLLQVLPELRRDRWAALLHRPLARGWFFGGKAVAGGLLYLAATGLPLLVSVWLVATPGNFPTPFVPAMARPGLADLLAGLCYYFAGLLIALEGGSAPRRALPLLAAVGVSFFCVEAKLFRVAVEASLAMAAVLALAGWGAIHARHALASRPWLGRAASLVVAFYGACGLGDLARWLGALAGHPGQARFSIWEMLESGVPARLTYVDSVLASVTDVNGRPFPEAKYRPDQARMHTLGMNQVTRSIGETHPAPAWEYESRYRETRCYLLSLSPYDHPDPEQWFYLERERVFVGVRLNEKRLVGSLGADGFTTAGARGRAWPSDCSYSELRGTALAVSSRAALCFADLVRRQMETITLPAPGPIYGAGYSWVRDPSRSAEFVGVALRDRMAVYDAYGKLTATLPYRHDVERWGEVSLGVLPGLDRFLLYYAPSAWIPGASKREMPSFVDVVDAHGRLLTADTLPPLPPYVNPPPWTSLVGDWLRRPSFFFGEILYRRAGAALGSARLRQALEKQLGPDWPETWSKSRHLLPAALLFAALTYAWARRAQLSARRAAGWSVAALLLGLPGFLVFWLAGERPRTVPCPSCERRRRLDREQCAHCGAGWPSAARDGSEILELPAPASAAAQPSRP